MTTWGYEQERRARLPLAHLRTPRFVLAPAIARAKQRAAQRRDGDAAMAIERVTRTRLDQTFTYGMSPRTVTISLARVAGFFEEE